MELGKTERVRDVTNLTEYKAKKQTPKSEATAPGDPLTSAAFHLMMAVKQLKKLSPH